jgi:hypothetical protein
VNAQNAKKPTTREASSWLPLNVLSCAIVGFDAII